MVNANKLDGLLRNLENSVGQLQELVKTERTVFLKDSVKIGATRYYLQISIEACINIANHLIGAENFRAPQDYGDTFKVLNENGVLPDDLTASMKQLAGLRNLLVHVYWEIDDGKIYDDVQSDIGDFDTYVRHILEFVKRQRGG